ncbi:MAG: YHS domain-containing protein [Candidatus Bathyarchaeota archaeon]|nr:MAG: YHS domain-containing protein [Candidatus Bathyarchaeota archaeon]
MARDPVCSMTVDEEKAKWKSEYEGETYYFCNEGCKKAFDKAPQRFVR